MFLVLNTKIAKFKHLTVVWVKLFPFATFTLHTEKCRLLTALKRGNKVSFQEWQSHINTTQNKHVGFNMSINH